MEEFAHLHPPSLLTDNDRIFWCFSNHVEMECPVEVASDLDLESRPLPLVAESWIGILTKDQDGFVLDAFSETSITSGKSYDTYSPDWNNSIDEFDLIPLKITSPGEMHF